MKAKKMHGLIAVLAAVACAFTVAACETKPANASVVFDLAGGGLTLNGSPVAETTITVKDGDKITDAIQGYAAAKTGYDFTGWTDAEGNALADQTASKSAAFTVKATYTIKNYTVVLNLDGGTYDQAGTEALTFEYGQTITLENPEKRGYDFGGWYTDDGFSTALNDGATMGAAGFPVYAKWTAKQYSITYEHGANTINAWYHLPDTWAEGLPAQHTFGQATQLPMLDDDWYYGDHFAGWRVVESNTPTGDVLTELAADAFDAPVTLRGVWERKTFAISYDLAGGQWPDEYTAPTQHTTGAMTYIAREKPTREGYTFEKFTCDSEAINNTQIPANTRFHDLENDTIVCTAVWIANDQNITLYLDGGKYNGESDPVLVFPTDTVIAEALTEVPTKERHRFVGWYLDADTNNAMPADMKVPVGNTNLYAKWETVPGLKTVAYYDGETKLGDFEYYAGTPLAPEYTLDDATMAYDGWYDGEGNYIGATTYTQAADVPDAIYVGSKYPADMTFTDDAERSGYAAKHAGNTATVSFPSVYRGLPVTQAYVNTKGSGTFATPTAVTIPASVKVLPNYAFYGLTQATTVTFEPGSALESVGNYAFYNCKLLGAIELPATVSTLGEKAFQNCSGLQTVSFTGVSRLTTLDNYAFASTGLTEFTVPASVTTVGTYVFSSCASLRTVTFDGAANSTIAQIPTGMFQSCSQLTSLTLPAGVTDIGASAFKAAGIKTFDFTKITAIGSNAFQQSALTAVSLPGTVTISGNFNFASCASLKTVTMAAGMTLVPNMFNGCTLLDSVTLPGDLLAISDGAFNGCTALTTITLPTGVASIGASAFTNSGLTAVTIPASVTEIGDSAFSGAALNTLTFAPNSTLSEIGKLAFSACTSLGAVALPASLQTIGTIATTSAPVTSKAGAFYGCTGLTSVTFAGNVTTLGDGTFSGCNQLGDLSVTVTNMGSRVFLNAFAAASSLTVTFTADYDMNPLAFVGLHAGSVTVSGMTQVGVTTTTTPNATFVNNAKNDKAAKSSTWASVPTFTACTNLTSVTFATPLTDLKNLAFYQCGNLQTVTIAGTAMPTLLANPKTFEGTGITEGSKITVYVDAALVDEYTTAFSGLDYDTTYLTFAAIPTSPAADEA